MESTGYGLFIAKSIALAHGGKIWAESAGREKGSTFFVELPLNPPDLNSGKKDKNKVEPPIISPVETKKETPNAVVTPSTIEVPVPPFDSSTSSLQAPVQGKLPTIPTPTA